MAWEILNEIYNSFIEMAYEIYKLNWLMARPYLQNKTEAELELGGEIYVCFDEFYDTELYEFRNWYCEEVQRWVEGYKER